MKLPRPVCPDCGTPFIGAAGPGGCILVPACWCAEDRRKAEAQAAWERRKAGLADGDPPEEAA